MSGRPPPPPRNPPPMPPPRADEAQEALHQVADDIRDAAAGVQMDEVELDVDTQLSLPSPSAASAATLDTDMDLDVLGDTLAELDLGMSPVDSTLSRGADDWDSVEASTESIDEDLVMPQRRAVSITADTSFRPQSYNALSEESFTSLSDLVHSAQFKTVKPAWSTSTQADYSLSRSEAELRFERRALGRDDDAGPIINWCWSFSFDWVKFDVFRDFFQIMGLFFTGIDWPPEFRDWFGAVAELVAIDFDIILPQLTPLAVFWIITMLGLVLMAVFYWRHKNDPDAIRDGHESRQWEQRGKGELLSIQVLLTILTTLYMPISRNAIQMFVCHRSYREAFAPEGCWGALHILHIIACLPAIVLITFYLPYQCYVIIQANKPTEVLYDAEGRRKTYTDDDYKKDLAKDKCPYRFLYKGYERKWAFYKVVVMVVKLALILAVILFATMPTVQAGASIAILAVFTALSLFTAPFIKDEDDHIDQSGRITTLVTVCLGYARILIGADPSYPILLNLINILNIFIMLFFALLGFQFFKTKLKNLTSRVDFTQKMAWDLRKERKLRIWHAFWDSLFLNVEEFAPCADRLMELKDVAGSIGVEEYRKAIQPVSKQVQLERKFVRENLEGVDVYWDGGKEEVDEESQQEQQKKGKNKGQQQQQVVQKTRTYFGKMYVIPFPFQCVMVYDDSTEVAFIKDNASLVRFAELNRSPEVRRKRSIRTKLRALSGQMVNFTYREMRMKQLGAGEAKRSMEVEFVFHRGRLEVSARKKYDWAPGFTVRMHFEDGRGEAEGQVWTDEKVTIGHPELGITDQFEETEQLKALFADAGNQEWLTSSTRQLVKRAKIYRDKLHDEQLEKESVLSNGFWYYVYNNDVLPRNELVQFLRVGEKLPALKALAVKHAAGLDYLYGRLEFYDAHPTLAYWYVFFSDLWEQNRRMSAFKDKELVFSPQSPTSLCYNLMLRKDLEAFALKQGMRTEKGGGLLKDSILDKLYSQLGKLCKEKGQMLDDVRSAAKPVEFERPDFDNERTLKDDGMGVALGNNAAGIRLG